MTLEQFARSKLTITVWPKIKEIFDAVERGERKILIRSCNGAGKTSSLAAICNWKLSEDKEAIVLTTASSWTQVKRSLWGEIRGQARRASLYPGTEITGTEIQVSDKNYAIGISPNLPENAQGYHAPSMLIVIDEAISIEREILDALTGNLTGQNSQIIMICNPTRVDSVPYEEEQSGEWCVITISAFEHPNVIEGRERIKGAVTREWIEDRLRAWSYIIPDDSDFKGRTITVPWTGQKWRATSRVLTRIMGEWSDTDSDSFIAPSLVRQSWHAAGLPGARSVGCDVARFGEDKTVFAFFDGDIQLPFMSFEGRDLMATANRLHDLYKAGWTCIGIDDTGIGGGVCDRLRELGVPHQAINFARSPKQYFRPTLLANTRAEMYFVLEQELRGNCIQLLEDKELLQELCAPTLLVDPGSGMYRLSPKEDIKRKLGRSPDFADAVALARYAARLERLNLPRFF